MSPPNEVVTNSDDFTEKVAFSRPEPGNWVLPESMFAAFYLTFKNHRPGDKPFEVRVEEPVPDVLKMAFKQARETELKTNWRGKVDAQQVDELRRMVQASMSMIDVMGIYNQLRREATKACDAARIEWLLVMGEIPIYRYPTDMQFRMVPIEGTAD